MPHHDSSHQTTGSCDRCGGDIPPGARPLSYRLIPTGQMDKAASGVYTPWSIHLCARCYDVEHR